MKNLMASLRIYIALTILVGLIYPIVVTVAARGIFNDKSRGSMIEREGRIVGSALIGQKFEGEKYFRSRPSATDYVALPSGGSNLGPTSSALKEAVAARVEAAGPGVPLDLIYASGSGLDPEISPEAALFQIPRVAKARGVSEDEIRSKVERYVQKRQLGFLGEERVNVLRLNLALDESR